MTSLLETLKEVRQIACESGNSITDNAEFWTTQQIRNHAQQTNCQIADLIDQAIVRAEGKQ